MSRFGSRRVPDCRCEHNFTCGPCLRESELWNIPAIRRFQGIGTTTKKEQDA